MNKKRYRITFEEGVTLEEAAKTLEKIGITEFEVVRIEIKIKSDEVIYFLK